MKLKGLGRGLDALLAGNEGQGAEQQRALPVAQLQPGKYQPRTQMDSASLEELAASIRAHFCAPDCRRHGTGASSRAARR